MNNLNIQDIQKVAQLSYDWEKLKNKTILMSGGTGFVGGFLTDVIRYRNKFYDNRIKLVSISRHGGISDDTVTHIKQDITQPVKYEGRVDYVLHLASNTHPKQYGDDPVGTITTNIMGCFNLLEMARNKDAERFILASSVEIYGQCSDTKMKESDCGILDCNTARSGYNEAKRLCESLCHSYKQQYGVDCVIIRFSRIFGADKKKDTKAIAQFIDRALENKNVVLNSYGKQRYSFCYIADAVSALLKVLIDGKCDEVYNVSDDDEGKTLGEYAELIAGFSNCHVTYEISENQNASKATYALLDTTKIKCLGWKPMYKVSDALFETFKIKKSII